jgi:hypothetical protein
LGDLNCIPDDFDASDLGRVTLPRERSACAARVRWLSLVADGDEDVQTQLSMLERRQLDVSGLEELHLEWENLSDEVGAMQSVSISATVALAPFLHVTSLILNLSTMQGVEPGDWHPLARSLPSFSRLRRLRWESGFFDDDADARALLKLIMRSIGRMHHLEEAHLSIYAPEEPEVPTAAMAEVEGHPGLRELHLHDLGALVAHRITTRAMRRDHTTHPTLCARSRF